MSKYIYKLNDSGLVEFVVEKINDKIKDFYFKIKDELETMDVKDDIYIAFSHLFGCLQL